MVEKISDSFPNGKQSLFNIQLYFLPFFHKKFHRYNLLQFSRINSNCYSANVIIQRDSWSGSASMVSCSSSSFPTSTNRRTRRERLLPTRNSTTTKMVKSRQTDTPTEKLMEHMKVLAWYVKQILNL